MCSLAPRFAPDPQEESSPESDEGHRRGEHRRCGAGRAPGSTENDHERDEDECLDAVRPDPQLRPPDGDRKALRPAEDELQRARDDDQAKRIRRTDVLGREEQPDEVGRKPQEKRDGDQDCGTLTVPIDYADPQGATFELALLRVPATGARVGSLVVNPGGKLNLTAGFVRGSFAVTMVRTASTPM